MAPIGPARGSGPAAQGPATPEPPSPSIDDVSAGEEAYYPLVFLSSDLGAEEEDLVPSEHAAAHP